ncbi:adam dec1 [Mactra antiquata]
MLKFKFKAFERTFTTILRRDNGHISPDFLLETSAGHSKTELPLLYSGTIQEDGSKIQGVLKKKGHFEGSITSQNETFYIESASHHFDDVTNFHTIIYKHSDVIFNTSQSFCAQSKLFNTQKSLISDIEIENLSTKRYLNGSNTNSNFEYQANKHSRRKTRSVDPRKKICELYLQVDHLFYNKYDGDVDTIIEKLSEHVQAANAIYNKIDFDKSGNPDHLGFIIKKIKIWDDPTVKEYRYDGNYAVDYFLTIHSKYNYTGFCLSYMFTNRDFSDGVLGLAWIADKATSVAGGVCETHKKFNGIGMSLNCGVLTFRNYGSDVPSAVSYPTFAHELGHSLGAEHDPVECMPGDPTGNYVMYASSTSGHKENNFKLSSCSINQIQPVIAEKARGEDGCFVEYTVALCGNRIVEEGEECDCGWEEECLESCCNPQVYDKTLPGMETPCTLRSTSVCRPSDELNDIPTGKSLPGTPCNMYKGYCDIFNVCRKVLVGKFCSKSTKDRVKLLKSTNAKLNSPKPRSTFQKPRRNQIVPDTYI